MNAERTKRFALPASGGRTKATSPRFHAIALALSVALVGPAMFMAASPVSAQQAVTQPQPYSIGAGSLQDALEALASQSDIQVIYSPELVVGKTTKGLSGTFAPREALRRLLEGTGLTPSAIDGSTFILRQPPVTPKPKPAAEPSAAPEPEAAQPTTLQAVTVIGSRIPLATEQQSVPVHVYTSEDIELSGQTTVADFLNTLPQVSVPSVPGVWQTFASLRNVRLHGMPVGTTLVLLDGLRPQVGGHGYFDLSAIPLAAIERIEVIPVGTSAIYGSDALAGVINFVTKKDFDGAEINVRYGTMSGANDTSTSAAWGRNWERGAVSFVASHHRQGKLSASERAMTATADFRDYGGRDYRSDNCSPGNIYGLGGATLAGLDVSATGIPAGISGTPTIDDFRGSDGEINQCDTYRNMTLIPTSEQYGAKLSAHYQLAQWIDVFADVLYSKFENNNLGTNLLSMTNGRGGSYVVPATNPFNPFGQDVGVSWSYGTKSNERHMNFIRPVVGARGALPGDWHWELTSLYAKDTMRILSPSMNSAKVRAALISTDPATALNVFSDVPGSAELVRSLYTASYNQQRNSLFSSQAVVRGPLFTLPAGQVQAVFGATGDRLRIWDRIMVEGVPAPASDRRREGYAVFTEARVPIVGSTAGDRHDEILTLSAAGRYDHADDFGGKATFQAGLEWRPWSSLLVRGAYGTSYRAPQLAQIYGSILDYEYSVADPRRDFESYSAAYPTGPNPNLRPETGVSKSLGLVYSSASVAGLESSLTWWSIDYTDYIGSPSTSDVINYPDRYPAEWLVRASPSAEDQAMGWPGRIISIRNSPVNFGSIKVAGVDFDARYRIPSAWGTWIPSIAFTETYRYEVALLPSQPAYDAVSKASRFQGYSPRWKGNIALGWERNAISAGVGARYISSYEDYKPESPDGHILGNFWLVDAHLRYDLGRHFDAGNWMNGAYLNVSGVNVFDRKPQFSYFRTGYDFQQTDIRGRFLNLQVGIRL